VISGWQVRRTPPRCFAERVRKRLKTNDRSSQKSAKSDKESARLRNKKIYHVGYGEQRAREEFGGTRQPTATQIVKKIKDLRGTQFVRP
jgi:hypothetical protein